MDKQLFVCEFINKLVSQFPQLAHNEGHIGSKEAVKSSPIVLSHAADERLNAVLRNLSHTDIL